MEDATEVVLSVQKQTARNSEEQPQTPLKDEEVSSDDATEDKEFYEAQDNTTIPALSSSSTTSSETNLTNVKATKD